MDEGILVDPTAGVKASLSASGTLAYLKGRAQYQPVVAHAGSSATEPLIKEPAAYSTPRYSPDGQRVAVAVFGTTGSDIWVYDIPRNTFTRLTSNGNSIRPEWTPDGRSVVYALNRGVPFFLSNREAQVSQDILRLAQSVAGERVGSPREDTRKAAPQKKSLFSFR